VAVTKTIELKLWSDSESFFMQSNSPPFFKDLDRFFMLSEAEASAKNTTWPIPR
jgi:hypothetical protein